MNTGLPSANPRQVARAGHKLRTSGLLFQSSKVSSTLPPVCVFEGAPFTWGNSHEGVLYSDCCLMTYRVYSPRGSVGSLSTTTATASKASAKKWIAQLETSSLLFQHLICQLLANFFRSWIRKDCILKSLSSVNVLREIRKFHVVVLQWRQRNVHNSLMHVQSCCFAVLARWRRRCCLSSPTYNETTPSWIDKNYACATGSSSLEDHYRTEKSDCSWFKTCYAELNSPPVEQPQWTRQLTLSCIVCSVGIM